MPCLRPLCSAQSRSPQFAAATRFVTFEHVTQVCAHVCAGALEDDALLEAVVLLGALAGWSEGDRDLADSGLVRSQVAACGYRSLKSFEKLLAKLSWDALLQQHCLPDSVC